MYASFHVTKTLPNSKCYIRSQEKKMSQSNGNEIQSTANCEGNQTDPHFEVDTLIEEAVDTQIKTNLVQISKQLTDLNKLIQNLMQKAWIKT